MDINNIHIDNPTEMIENRIMIVCWYDPADTEYPNCIKIVENTFKNRGYDVGTSLDTLGFQKDSLEIDLGFFINNSFFTFTN